MMEETEQQPLQTSNHGKSNEEQLTSTELIGKVKFFKKRTKLVKYFACTIIIILFLVCVIFVTLYFNALSSKNTAEQGVCNDPECVQIAARIIETMDREVDPCNNFYEYACGSWIRNTPIPDSRSRYSRFEKLSERNSIVLKEIIQGLLGANTTNKVLSKAATYYESCVDVKQIQTVGNILLFYIYFG